jgi:hypothetical protein
MSHGQHLSLSVLWSFVVVGVGANGYINYRQEQTNHRLVQTVEENTAVIRELRAELRGVERAHHLTPDRKE